MAETKSGPFRVDLPKSRTTFAALCLRNEPVEFSVAIAWPEHVTMAQREEVVRRLCEQFGGSFFG